MSQLTFITKNPVTIDSWYEHTDGSYGFYVGAARAGGPTMTVYHERAELCVTRDSVGYLVSLGWPARAVLCVRGYDPVGSMSLRECDAALAESLARPAV